MNLLTAGRLSGLDSFSVPSDMCLSAVQPGHDRVIHREGPRNRVYHKCRASGDEDALMPQNADWWKTLPLLVLQFDQGPTCTAAAACLGQSNSILICRLIKCDFGCLLVACWEVDMSS